MKKHLLLLALIVSFSFILISFAKANNASKLVASSKDSASTDTVAVANEVSLSDKLFNDLHLQNAGLSKATVEYAVKGYEKLVDSGLVNNDQFLTIVDLSQPSRNKRLYILDMKNDKLVWNTYVAHGKNSGVDMAKSFSNQFNSNKSSLGFYVTKSTYKGKHGLSLRLGGLEHGFNDNAEARGVVVHGASYVNAGRVNSSYMGRSQGCPALPQNEYAQVINIIKGGSVMFIYNPSQDYLQSSALLN
ncbi:MAG TPA: murein L,D-transpeptidase catalytic domain family protein [Flavisolibacter sp.]|nr:murein L,D-transpeptidase catalytic domain family protein [Flavisolibacter sp.]